METTRFLNDTDINLDHWPIWKTIFTVFESNEKAKYSEGFQSCVTESVNKMMLFSEHREVYQNYWNSLNSTKLLKNYFPDLRRTDHQSKMSAILVKWFCMMENEYCLEQTKKNFDAVKNGNLRQVSIFPVKPVLIFTKTVNSTGQTFDSETLKAGLISILNCDSTTKCLDWQVAIGIGSEKF